MTITLIAAIGLFLLGIYPLVNAFFYYRGIEPTPTLDSNTKPYNTLDPVLSGFGTPKTNRQSPLNISTIAAARSSSNRCGISAFLNSTASKAHELRDKKVLNPDPHLT